MASSTDFRLCVYFTSQEQFDKFTEIAKKQGFEVNYKPPTPTFPDNCIIICDIEKKCLTISQFHFLETIFHEVGTITECKLLTSPKFFKLMEIFYATLVKARNESPDGQEEYGDYYP